MIMIIASSHYMLWGQIEHDDNWEAIYGYEDEQNILSCDF